MSEAQDTPIASVLITGAGGFVGRHLVACLGQALPRAVLHTGAFDVSDARATAAAVRAARPDACIHLAAVSAIPAARRDPGHAWQVNLHGTLNLAGAILENAPQCRLLFASTADAYGSAFRDGRAVGETTRLAPLNAYGATKAAADLALGAMAAEGLRVVRLRAFNHTGPGQSNAFVVAAFAEQIARIAAGRQPPVIEAGALEPQRDFLDVRDVCAAYAACIVRDLPPGQIINIASGVPRRIGDVLADLLAAAGVAAQVRLDPARLRPTEIPVAVGDPALAHRLLGWRPAIAWKQTIADVVADWRARVAAL
jgi:GDP-4-dehydro-6-deoxy-D-mannose reductase